jgi:hypothetical protein
MALLYHTFEFLPSNPRTTFSIKIKAVYRIYSIQPSKLKLVTTRIMTTTMAAKTAVIPPNTAATVR